MRLAPLLPPSSRRAGLLPGAAAWALLWAATALLGGEAAADVQVTALEGSARVADAPLSLHSSIAEGRPLVVDAAGRSTLLLADRTLVRICGPAQASVMAAGGSRPGQIELRRGTLVVVALAPSQQRAFRIDTPATRVVLTGPGARVRVAPDGETVVGALDSPVQLSGWDGAEAAVVEPGEQRTIRPGEGPDAARTVSRERQASSACPALAADHERALQTDRALLATGLPLVSAQAVDATPVPPANELLDVMRADFPTEGLPLQAPSPPSALVTELSKRGMNEEVCDPITCNPVYRVEPPGTCGVPPERGCIP